ncbi:MAG: hypothetical protein KA715_06965 [Xanthomonadaceae bacterium]|nr:hypothetical protein [Xanthomonadaceae bacterium]
MKYSDSLILGFSLILTAISTFAGGKGGGNGGDAVALEFKAIAHNITDHWDELEFAQTGATSKLQFKKAIRLAYVHSVEESLYIEGNEVDAINYPCPNIESTTEKVCGEIIINRKRWSSIGDDLAKFAALVFHEYLGVLGKDHSRFDDFYEMSAPEFVKLKSFFKTQYQIKMSFLCLLQKWDEKNRKVQVIHTIQTSEGSNEYWFELGGKEYSLEIRQGFEDLFTRTLTKSLTYALYPKGIGQFPDREHPISGDRVTFSSGRTSIRIMDQPELQMSCFQIYEGLKAEH